MDRNGKKAKAPRTDAAQHGERSDMKASRRDEPGRAGGDAAGGKGKAAAPPLPGRKGSRP